MNPKNPGLRKRPYATLWSEVRRHLLSDPEVRFLYDERKIKESMGEAISKARKRAGLTQAEVAKRAKTTEPVIARLERGGGGNRSVSLLHRIADAIGLAVSVLFRKKRTSD